MSMVLYLHALYDDAVNVYWWAHRKHEEGVKHESHGRKGLEGGHHVSLKTQRQDNEQGHSKQQQCAETKCHL